MVTSPLTRCRQTLELALPEVTPQVEDGLTECGYGEWEGQPLKKLAKDPLWQVVQQHPSAAVFPGGEAMAAMSARAVAAVRDWDARVTAEHGAGGALAGVQPRRCDQGHRGGRVGRTPGSFQRIVADPASVTVIRYTPPRPFVVRLNDTGGDLTTLVPPGKPRRRRSDRDSDAAVGGGAGAVAVRYARTSRLPLRGDRRDDACVPRRLGSLV